MVCESLFVIDTNSKDSAISEDINVRFYWIGNYTGPAASIVVDCHFGRQNFPIAEWVNPVLKIQGVLSRHMGPTQNIVGHDHSVRKFGPVAQREQSKIH